MSTGQSRLILLCYKTCKSNRGAASQAAAPRLVSAFLRRTGKSVRTGFAQQKGNVPMSRDAADKVSAPRSRLVYNTVVLGSGTIIEVFCAAFLLPALLSAASFQVHDYGARGDGAKPIPGARATRCRANLRGHREGRRGAPNRPAPARRRRARYRRQ